MLCVLSILSPLSQKNAQEMIPSVYSKFSVKIVDNPFCSEDGVRYNQTAILSFYGADGRFVLAHDFGYMTTAEIYAQIDELGALEVSNCYVKSFSATAYRRTRLMGKSDVLNLKYIKADNAFFDSEFQIDFTHLLLDEGLVDFSYAHFARGEVLFLGTNFGDGSVDFSNVVFRPKLVDFSNAIFGLGDLSFKNAIFYKGRKVFQYTDFGAGALSFVNVEFGGGEVAFLNTNFNKGNVSFKVADFGGGKVGFHYAKFAAGDISFERTSFGDGEVDFRTVEFGKGKVNFNRANFGDGDVSFEACSAEGRVTFKKTSFGEGQKSFELLEFDRVDLNLEKAILGNGNISFFSSQIQNLSLSGCHIDSYLDLRLKKCTLVNLSNTIVRDIVDLKPYEFVVDIEELNIAGMRLLGIIYIDWDKNQVERLVRAQDESSLADKAEQFLILKENFNKAGQYDHEDKAYVWFKRYEAKSNYEIRVRDKKIRKIWLAPIFGSEKLVFDYVGLYATNPMRVLFSMVVVYALFSMLYSVVLVAGLGNIVSGLGGEHDLLHVVGRSFYHSGVTFLTIGYGDFYPMGAVRWISNIEGFIGVFLMSYFTVAFVRRILR